MVKVGGTIVMYFCLADFTELLGILMYSLMSGFCLSMPHVATLLNVISSNLIMKLMRNFDHALC